ncbi:hypothetical protein ABZ079_29790 [Streptomyces sp. NPDC006314]|uniref:hypothetical protein n=1 Tax=Streptomyces sp. NPDC006314 TaxID=3154475 RepID=UPI00339F8223
MSIASGVPAVDTDGFPDGHRPSSLGHRIAFEVIRASDLQWPGKYKSFMKNDLSYWVDFTSTSKKSGTTTVGASINISGEVKALWARQTEGRRQRQQAQLDI